jgi:hypothetical protein
MDSESLDRAWDPAAPGAGALRATAVAQLYFRMTSHHPLTILIVDAMCLTFGADGVTVQELVDYLGITEDRIRFGLEGIPGEMRCTGQQLESEGTFPSRGDAPEDVFTNSSNGPFSSHRGEREVRYFLNYKRLLPLVYAHVTRLLLSTCVVEVPPCSYVDAVKAAQLAPYSRTADSTAHAFFSSAQPTSATKFSTDGAQREHTKSTIAAATPAVAVPSHLSSSRAIPNTDSAGEHIEVSDAMKRKSAIHGVYCFGCSCYFLVEEFAETLSRCPRCGKDSLKLFIQSIQRQLNARIADQLTVVRLLPGVSQVWKRNAPTLLAVQRQQQQPVAPDDGNTTSYTSVPGGVPSAGVVNARGATAAQQSLHCALADDPFLFQQALAFLFLFTSRFASVNDAASVVDVQQILTEPEYRERLRGKASLADQFRSRHRHATSVHVRLVPQKEVDAARRAESHRKLLKRSMLPPWLRHTASLEALGGSHVCTRRIPVEAEGQPSVKEDTAAGEVDGNAASATQESWTSEGVKTDDNARVSRLPHSGAKWKFGTEVPSTGVREKRKRLAEVDAKVEITRTADFIAMHFYEDDFDEVSLPLSHRHRR